MASARYWRICAVEVWTPGSSLTLSEVALYESGVAQTGSITSTATPSAGSLANLADSNDATSVSFAASDVFAPGFSINWDLGSAKDITKIGIKGTAQANFPRRFDVSYSADGNAWTVYGKTLQTKWTDSSTWYELDTAHGNTNADSTVLHLHCDDISASVFPFNSGTAPIVSQLFGTAKFVSDASAFNGRALLFSTLAQGSDCNNYVYSGASSVSALSFPGDFTIFCRLYAYAYSSQWGSFIASTTNINATSGTGFNFSFGYPGASNKVAFDCLGANLRSDAALPLNQWVELMITRSGTTARMLINGTLQSTPVTMSGITGATQLLMGRAYNGTGTTGICGMIDEFVVINGIALATASYTPYTAPFADALMGPVTLGNDFPSLGVTRRNSSILRLTGPTVGNVLQTVNMPRVNSVADNSNGTGTITGTVKQKALPVDIPLSRKVRLMRERDGKIVRETWSDATTGAYTFTGLDLNQAYTAIAWDHVHTYRAVIADNLTATR